MAAAFCVPSIRAAPQKINSKSSCLSSQFWYLVHMSYAIKKMVQYGKPISDLTLSRLLLVLRRFERVHRFAFALKSSTNGISFHKVRLKESKHYCGNHPLPCVINPLVKERHVKSRCLEGADWVAFNDMVNDALDEFSISANAGSSHCIIRKGLARCVEYTAKPQGRGNEWVKDSGCFADCIGKTARAAYPEGTPGNNSYLA